MFSKARNQRCRRADKPKKASKRARIKDQMRISWQGFGPAIFLPQLPGRSVCP
jgi:hypothetical protein